MGVRYRAALFWTREFSSPGISIFPCGPGICSSLSVMLCLRRISGGGCMMRTAVIVSAAAALVVGALGSWTTSHAESGYRVTFDPHGGVCFGGMEITVPAGGSYTLPTEGTGAFQCHRPKYTLAGWSHGHVLDLPGEQARVPVVAAGQSAVVVEDTALKAVWIPQGVEIIYDANVHGDDECLDHSGNNVPVDQRTSPAILHRADHHIAHHAPCTPPGHVLQGWDLKTDRGAAARSAGMLEGRDSDAPSPTPSPAAPTPSQGQDPTPSTAPTVAPGSQVSGSGLDSGTTPTLVANWGPPHHVPDPPSNPTPDPVLPTSAPTPTPLPTSTPSDPSKARCDLPPAPYVDWHDCDKSDIDFQLVELHGANLSGGNFSNTSFYGANLTDVNASSANFYNTYFATAILSGTNLSSADFTTADLMDAQGFSSATISGANFQAARWITGTVCDADSPLGECTVLGVKQSQG